MFLYPNPGSLLGYRVDTKGTDHVPFYCKEQPGLCKAPGMPCKENRFAYNSIRTTPQNIRPKALQVYERRSQP
jgi:hypothetical protein